MNCFELVAITGGVADLPSVPFEVQVGVELALCGWGPQVHSTANFELVAILGGVAGLASVPFEVPTFFVR